METTLIYDALTQRILGSKITPSRWMTFNGPCCIHNGQLRPDTRKRSGLIFDPDGSTSVSCFNCGFKTGWKPGLYLSQKLTQYMDWLGVPHDTIQQIKFKAGKMRRDLLDGGWAEPTVVHIPSNFFFPTISLPDECYPIDWWLEQDCTDHDFLTVLEYLASRGRDIVESSKYYWCPSRQLKHRVIIPFYWNDQLVGWTGRSAIPSTQRYYSEVPAHYLFNTDKQKENWRYLFLVEGPFDAIAVNGVASLGDKLTDAQINWLNGCGKKIVVIPDQINQGGKLTDIAVREGWSVSFPNWERGIKDTADAVNKLGKLYTLWSIVSNIIDDPFKISVNRQRLRSI